MKKLIVYDLDGTLVDTLEDLTQAANHMLGQFQKPPLLPADIRRFVGHGVHELVKRCFQTDNPEQIGAGVTIFRAYYAEHLLDQSRLYPNARKVLDYFRQQGRVQVVITNKPTRESERILEGLKVAGYFTQILGAEAGYPRKPDPSVLHALMRRLDLSSEEVLLIGDSVIDVETARNAGCKAVAITHGFGDVGELRRAVPAIGIVNNFRELLVMARKQEW